MQPPPADEVVYRDFVLSVFTDPPGCHIVKIAPTPQPTFRAFITLNPSSTVGALLRLGNPQKSAVFDSTWSKT